MIQDDSTVAVLVRPVGQSNITRFSTENPAMHVHATARPVIRTGDRTTGLLHLGHYVGSLKNLVALQSTHRHARAGELFSRRAWRLGGQALVGYHLAGTAGSDP